ncbi:outer membrane protein assembly factor BamC [Seminibacterium arietis]|uniref:Outer membrane protein assembly factor BamC n=1 Tax=Seminibacterium arietis TaxID=1173502 RepID=A0ABW3IBF4_9PAST
MKKWLTINILLVVLMGCSSDYQNKKPNDGFSDSNSNLPTFSTLETGGLNLPVSNQTYRIPQIKQDHKYQIDIRPPVEPIPIIDKSIAQFDGERALIAYPLSLRDVYNLKQIERLLTEQRIDFTAEKGKIITNWSKIERSDSIEDIQIRYQIEQVETKQASALFISIFQIKRGDIISKADLSEKQRYTSELLNHLIGELNSTYLKQQQDLSGL